MAPEQFKPLLNATVAPSRTAICMPEYKALPMPHHNFFAHTHEENSASSGLSPTEKQAYMALYGAIVALLAIAVLGSYALSLHFNSLKLNGHGPTTGSVTPATPVLPDSSPNQTTFVLNNLKVQPPSSEPVIVGSPPSPLIGTALTPSIGHVLNPQDLKENTYVILDAIRFETGSAIISSGIESVNVVASVAKDNRCQGGLIVSGYADRTGSNSINLVLSQKRADAVKQELIRLGVKKEILTAIGRGSAHPLDSASTPEAYTVNRRVEVFCAPLPNPNIAL